MRIFPISAQGLVPSCPIDAPSQHIARVPLKESGLERDARAPNPDCSDELPR